MKNKSSGVFRVTLLGTGAPPPVMDRFGPCTLVEAGEEKLIFDAGRGAMQRLYQLKIPFADVTACFLTHHHSDHVVGFPDLWLTGWIRRPWGQRNLPLRVWGPAGTKEMMSHLAKAYHVDIQVRSKNYPIQGVTLQAEDFVEGVVYETDNLRVTAFEVDHGSELLPAFGYRIDYGSRSVVISGDTTFNENLIRHSRGVDLLVHEVTGVPPELLRATPQFQRITRNHTTPEQAGELFFQVQPKMAVYTHILLFGDMTADDLIPLTRKKYSGPLEIGEDLMSIEIAEEVRVRRLSRLKS
ncbi:MAG: MBL fold metallo-hydrolase [Candidatus Binatia bacterium]